MPPIQHATQLPHVRASIARERRFINPFTTAGYANKALKPSRFNSRKEVQYVGPEQQQRQAVSHGTKHWKRGSDAILSTHRSVQDRVKQPSLPAIHAPTYQRLLQYRHGRQLKADRLMQHPPAGQHEGRREQSHRPVRTRHERDPHPMKPLPLPTDSLGYVTWKNWDCRPWETYQLWAYHMSRHYHLEKRIMKHFHWARSKAKRYPRDQKHFWYSYYARARSASEKSRAFQLYLIETQAITTLLRTAPKVIYRRLASTIFPVNDKARELRHLLEELHELQRLRLNQIPLLYQPLETRVNIVPQDLEQIETMCNASPQLWTVEPMTVSLTLGSHRFIRVLGSLVELRRMKGGLLPWKYVRRSEDLQRAIRHNVWELSELGHELKALRHYQLNRYLDSPSLTSVTMGKQLWRRLQALQQGETNTTQIGISTLARKTTVEHSPSFVRSATGEIMLTNARGFFSFHRWTGGDWVVERLQYYKTNYSVIAAVSAEAEYQAVAMRPRHTIPPRVRGYLLSYYSAMKQVNERLHPYMRYHANSCVIIFLLRTAPSWFSTRFGRTLGTLDALNYDMSMKLEDLRRSQVMLACLPSSPLLFQGLVIRTVVNSAIARSGKSRRLDGKLIRAGYKATAGIAWTDIHHTDYERESDMLLRHMLSKHRRSPDWTRQYPCAVAEPLYNAVGRVRTMYAQLKESLQNVKDIVIALGGTVRWRQMEVVSEFSKKTVLDLLELARHFTAMRYYRAQHFPGSISVGEMFVPNSLLEASSRTPSDSRKRAISRPRVIERPRVTPTTKGAKGRVRRVPAAVVVSRKPRRHKRQIDLNKVDIKTHELPKARSRNNHGSKQDERHIPRAPKERPLYTRSGRQIQSR